MPIFRRTHQAGPLPWPENSPQGLAARWMRWVASAPPHRDPVADETGEYAAARQPADVFFLAGTYGSRVRRSCAVPAGVPLFFPVVNQWANEEYGSPKVADADGETLVDGVDHPLTEIFTEELFEVAGAVNNGATGTHKLTHYRIWGLWSQVPPLAPGGHTLRFIGRIGHGFRVDATYELTVG